MNMKYNREKFANALAQVAQGENVNQKTIRQAQRIASKICKVQKVKLCTDNTPKIEKSNKPGIDFSVIMHLAPHKLSGYNACPMASKGCIKACLNTSGHGRYSMVQEARIKKTKFFFEHRELFGLVLFSELNSWQKKAAKKGMNLAVRLNGTSDIQWEKIFPWVFRRFKNVTFYDYTKIDKRFKAPVPANYFLTFSRAENNQDKSVELLDRGFNVAVVFQDLPKAMETGYHGHEVIDGVINDRRFADSGGVVVGLKALAKAKKDTSGFVVRNK